MNMQPRKMPADEERRLAKKAVRMLNYVACLNYAIDDLETDLRQLGIYKGMAARCFKMSERIIINAHSRAYDMLMSINSRVGREYNAAMDDMWTKIENCVLLPHPERGFNIVVALCRLITKLNKELGHRYYFAPAAAISTIPSKLDVCQIKDYELDRIIELNTHESNTENDPR